MKCLTANKENSVDFRDIEPGSLFGYEGEVYIKLSDEGGTYDLAYNTEDETEDFIGMYTNVQTVSLGLLVHDELQVTEQVNNSHNIIWEQKGISFPMLASKVASHKFYRYQNSLVYKTENEVIDVYTGEIVLRDQQVASAFVYPVRLEIVYL